MSSHFDAVFCNDKNVCQKMLGILPFKVEKREQSFQQKSPQWQQYWWQQSGSNDDNDNYDDSKNDTNDISNNNAKVSMKNLQKYVFYSQIVHIFTF